MADPARRTDEPRPDRPISPDPFNPMPPLTPEETAAAERRADANADERRIEDRVDIQSERRTGTSVLIAAVVLIIALIAYLVFASTEQDTAVPPEGPAMTTEPAGEAAPAPNATAPAEPAPNTTAPAPTEPAPATPAPEPAPAQ